LKGKCFCFVLLFLASFSASAQLSKSELRQKIEPLVPKKNKWKIEGNYTFGKIFKHSERFIPTITEPSHFYSLSFIKSTTGNKQWQQLFNYPDLVFDLTYANFGDSEIFGDALSAYISLNQSKYNHKLRLTRHWRYGFGVGYLNKPFHQINNPTNNVIGSEVNLTMKLAYGYEYRLQTNLGLSLMAIASHHSNGRVELPNLGINVLGLKLGLKYYSQAKQDLVKHDFKQQIDKKPKLQINIGFARSELSAPINGPKYPVYIIGLFGQHRTSLKSKWLYGIEASYFESTHRFILNNQSHQEKEFLTSSRLSPYVGYEHIIGQLGIVGMLGAYAYGPFKVEAPISTKMGFKYYVLPTENRFSKEIFIAGYLKAHYAKAEYLEVNLGYTF